MATGLQTWHYVRALTRQDSGDGGDLAPLCLYLEGLGLSFTCFRQDSGEALLVGADPLIEAKATQRDPGAGSAREKLLFAGGDVDAEQLEELMGALTRGPLGWEHVGWLAMAEELPPPGAGLAPLLTRSESPARLELDLPGGARAFELYRVSAEARPEAAATTRSRPIVGEGDGHLAGRQDWWQRRHGSLV